MKIIISNTDWQLQLPEDTGVYRYYNVNNELLYVGKAINLKKRILSYFKKNYQLSPRIAHMVSKIAYIEITIADNEASALILENNFIKNLRPRYNILFTDDKSYPYIKISKHDFPVVGYYRGKINVNDSFFGPYPNGYAVKQVIELLQKLFRLRTCSDNEFNGRSRPCLLYQVKRCSAPCVQYIKKADYQESIKFAKRFLNGEYSLLVHELTQQMYASAQTMDFEKAALLRDQIVAIKELSSKQIVSSANSNLTSDLILIEQLNGKVYFYIMHIKNGVYVGDKNYIVNYAFEIEYAVECFVDKFYANQNGVRLLFGFKLTEVLIEYMQVKYQLQVSEIPQRYHELVAMGAVNLKKIIENDNLVNIYAQGVIELSNILNLSRINRIECYDISHHGGLHTVGAMTVFENGVINSKLYRKYNLEGTNGNDLLALEIVLRRRFANVDLAFPDVLLIDGGFPQYNVAKNIIRELGFYDKIVVTAIFKGEKRNELQDSIILGDNLIISYIENPKLFKLLQPLRDEAHRFSITAHRNKKIKSMTKTRLTKIPNIGSARRKLLLAYFGDIDSIANATIDDLMQVKGIGVELASMIVNFFKE